MNLRRTFRILVVVDFILMVTSAVVDQYFESSLPLPLREYISSEIRAPVTPRKFIYIIGGAVPFAGYLIGSVGLVRLWRPSREVYAGSLIAMELLGLVAGPGVWTVPGELLATIAYVLAGMILGIAYFSELRTRFFRIDHGTVTEYQVPPNPPLNPPGTGDAPAG